MSTAFPKATEKDAQLNNEKNLLVKIHAGF